MNTYRNFQEAYYGVLKDIYTTGEAVTVRGLEMREKIPYYFEIANPRDRLLNINCRKNTRKYTFGELMWYLSGRDDVAFISKYSKVWGRLSDDGIHSNSAYGKYIFRPMPNIGFGSEYTGSNDPNYNSNLSFKTQWDYVKEVLQKDPYSRQAVIQIKPVQMYDTKDITCTYFLQFFIREGKLDLVVGMRSNDVIYGTTYDVFMFTFLQELMAAELGIDIGIYKHFSSNTHVYMKDKEIVEKILEEKADNRDTLVFDKIPANFRENDLPILLELEEAYWKYKDDINKVDDATKMKYNKLSNVGKQLFNLLVD